MPRLLLTWSDRAATESVAAHHGPRPASDKGPLLRLLEHSDDGYDAARVLATPAGERGARALASEMGAMVPDVTVAVLGVSDPSDFSQLYRALEPLVAEMTRAHPRPAWNIDVVLSAGTPQMQTLWVILVQAGLLPARMLQVIPAAFVPRVHPRAVREVRLDIEGFPEIRALRDEVVRLRAATRVSAGTILGESEPIRALRVRLARLAGTDVPVLIRGETGTGKELAARALHDGSARAQGPFVAENCGAFAEGVLASELFGHESGAFTGATGRRRGLFEQAHGGTLFLDEVGELAPRTQSSLLRALQEGAVRRVGGERPVRVDVRVVAATHRDLSSMVAAGTFREDLYYRLRGATLVVPPLRERIGDLPLLIDSFLDSPQREQRPRRGRRRLTISPEAMRALHRYRWPGNVRELRAEVTRWTVFCDDAVEVDDLADEIRGAAGDGPNVDNEYPPNQDDDKVPPLSDIVASAERGAIAAALVRYRGNLAQTARALAIDRNTLKRKLALYRLPRRRGS